jgi:outer membrane protein assembly factor BamE (lipoprotein component of BamABCDE complex)
VTALYKKNLKGGQLIDLLIVTILFAVLLNNSSCYTPWPAILTSEGGIITDKLITSLKEGETTREDVLLLLGEPFQRGEQDRYFIYYWAAIEGDLTVFYNYSIDFINKHFFCVEFNKDNRIKRFEHIDTGLVDGLFKHGIGAHNKMQKWISETGQ